MLAVLELTRFIKKKFWAEIRGVLLVFLLSPPEFGPIKETRKKQSQKKTGKILVPEGIELE